MFTKTADTHCVACGGVTVYFGARGAYHYVRCLACDTLQLSPMPTPEMLARAYAEDYLDSGHTDAEPEKCGRSQFAHHASVVRALRDYLPAGRVAEVGAGWGCLYRR
jgi:hypothetical protein